MPKLGKTPARALESFGIAGLLSEQSQVFYCSLFSPRHLGRVSDLICARLLDSGLDELRLRALLLFGAFEVFRVPTDSPAEASRRLLDEPLIVECGIDEDQVGIAVSFSAPEGRFPNLEGLVQRITEGQPSGSFEALLCEIHRHSDRTIVRVQADVRRVEIVALIGLSVSETSEATREPVELIEITTESAKPAPQVQSYTELGDLDYPELLRANAPGASAPPSSTGEILVTGANEVEEAVRVRAATLLEKISGVTIKGKAEDLDNEVIRISGGTAQVLDQMVTKVNGAATAKASAFSNEARVVSGGAAPAPSKKFKVRSLFSKSSEQEETSERAASVVSAESAEESDDEESSSDESSKIKAIIHRVKDSWPFRFGKRKPAAAESEVNESDNREVESVEQVDVEQEDLGQNDVEQEELEQKIKAPKALKTKKLPAVEAESELEPELASESEEEVEQEEVRLKTTEVAHAPASKSVASKPAPKVSPIIEDEENPVAEEEPVAEDASTPEAASAPEDSEKTELAKHLAGLEKESDDLTSKIHSGMERTIQKLKIEADELKRELENPKTKRWVDGMMSELVSEKARLHVAAKNLNSSIRQQEYEFKKKEQTLKEELRRRDEELRQKNNTVTRLKEQLTQAAVSAERMKTSLQAGADDAHYKQKYSLVQKMLTSTKEENMALAGKVDDLKNQLMTAQLSSSKRNGPSQADFSALQGKFDRALRAAEDAKKQNSMLIDKLAEAKKERVGGGQDEFKKRFEVASKVAATHQKEAERLTSKVEEMQREQMRLQGELNRANSELKAAKSGKGQSKAAGAAGTAPPAKPKPPKAA